MAEAVPTEINIFARDINFAILEFKESNKDALFKKLFELMTFKCGEIWEVVLHSTSYTQTVGSVNLTTTIESLLEQLESIFYSKSKWIKVDGSKDFDNKKDIIKETARIVKESYRIDPIPSRLFLEFLLFVATKIRDTSIRTDEKELRCLGELARRSDQESVLNIAQEIDRFFTITTEQTTKEIFQQILQIYKECGITFTGNISISHIIGQLCEGITGTVMQTESSQSQSLDKPLEVRSVIEQMLLNRYNNETEAIVQTSPPPVKSGITKTKPISSIRNPSYLVLSSRTKARPDATTKQPVAVQPKPTCPYGSKCYRTNPQHKLDYSHPPNNPPWKPGGGSGKSKRSHYRSSAKRSRRRLSSKRAKRRTTRRR